MVYFTTFPRGALEDNKKAHHIILAKVSFFHLILKGYNVLLTFCYTYYDLIYNTLIPLRYFEPKIRKFATLTTVISFLYLFLKQISQSTRLG